MLKREKDGQSEALRTGKGSTRKETDFRHGISSESHTVLLAIFRTLYNYIQFTCIAIFRYIRYLHLGIWILIVQQEHW